MTTPRVMIGPVRDAAWIRVDALDVTRGDAVALRDATLALQRGELLGVIGPNGSGKTTLLRTMAGLQSPTRGSVTLNGRPLAAWSAPARARLIGSTCRKQPPRTGR